MKRFVNALCWIGIFLAGTGMASIVVAARVHGHDPLTHQANALSDARSTGWGLCCNGKDYTVPKDWSRNDDGSYRVLIDKAWLPVPKEAEVTNMRNPDMEAKVWFIYGEGEVFVRCFMPGSEV